MRLSGLEVKTAYWCLATMLQSRRRDVPRPVSDLFDRLDFAFQRMSQPRHDVGAGAGDTGTSKWIGAAEVAELLGISARTVQRNYRAMGGELVSSVLVFDRAAVIAHREAVEDV